MSRGNGTNFFIGALVGAALGAVAGMLMAPRAGRETRSAFTGAATDAWGNVVDAYQQGARRVNEELDDLRTNGDVATDELREKVDQARLRMDQIRSSLSEGVNQAADRARAAVNKAAEQAGQAVRSPEANVQAVPSDAAPAAPDVETPADDPAAQTDRR